jgi:hypothetical protein
MPMSPRLLRPIASGSFDPRTISGLSAWIDFSDLSAIGPDQTGPGVVASGGEIGYIRDKFVTARTYTQGTGASRPVLGAINGLPAGDWGSSANSKVLVASSSAVHTECVAVCAWDAGGSTFPTFNTVLGNGATGAQIAGRATLARWQIPLDGTSYDVLFQNNVATNVAFPTIASGDPFIVQSAGSGTHTARIGLDRALADRGWRGRIGEILTWNRTLTADERAAIRRGLARKWKFAI